MEQVKQYLDRFRQAATIDQQRTVVEEYQAFYATRPAHEQAQADEVMRVLQPEIDNEVADLEQLVERAQQQLKYRPAHSVRN